MENTGIFQDAQTGGLRRKTLVGIVWVTGTQVGRQVAYFVVSVILARMLTPQDYGLVGMVLIFTQFATLLSELGLGAALIQRESIQEIHCSSVFYANIIMGLVLTVFTIVLSPFLANFFHEPRLASLSRLIAVNFTITSLNTVPHALISRKMEFWRSAIVEITAVVVAGIVAIILAKLGWGVWSLVWQMLITSATTTIALFLVTGWHPSLRFDRSALADLWRFSGHLLSFNAINYWIRHSDNLLVGKFFDAAALGIYARAYSLMLLPLTQITSILTKVMFPALSRIQNDKDAVKRIYLRSLALIAMITFPMMFGLWVVSEHFVLALLGPRWSEVIPILRVFCLVGAVQSLSTTTGWIYQSQGRTDMMFRWGLGAGILLIGSILIGIWMGNIYYVSICYAIMSSVVLFYPSFSIPGKLINMSVWEVICSIRGVFICAVVMALFVWGIDFLVPVNWNHWGQLIAETGMGAAVYLTAVLIFRLKAYQDLRNLWTSGLFGALYS